MFLLHYTHKNPTQLSAPLFPLPVQNSIGIKKGTKIIIKRYWNQGIRDTETMLSQPEFQNRDCGPSKHQPAGKISSMKKAGDLKGAQPTAQSSQRGKGISITFHSNKIVPT